MINSRDVKELSPKLQELYKKLESECTKLNIPIKLTSTYRDVEYQNMLFNKVPKVTNAKGGDSYHNYRLAFDICINIKGKEYDKPLLTQVGNIGKKLGLEWGGDFKKIVDMPHFQFTNGKTIAMLKKENGIK